MTPKTPPHTVLQKRLLAIFDSWDSGYINFNAGVFSVDNSKLKPSLYRCPKETAEHIKDFLERLMAVERVAKSIAKEKKAIRRLRKLGVSKFAIAAQLDVPSSWVESVNL